MDAGAHRYFDTSSDELNGALKVKDEAIVLTAAVIRFLARAKMSQTGTPGSHIL